MIAKNNNTKGGNGCVTVTDLYAHIDRIIPRSLSVTGDNDGLMCCPIPERAVRRVMIALDVTERVADEAIAGNFDVILAHHPIIYRPLSAISGGGTPAILIKLIRAGISVMSFHTRLDASNGGVNDILARLCGLSSLSVLAREGSPMGRVGVLEQPIDFFEYANTVKRALCAPAVSASYAGKSSYRVAVLGGSGKDYLHDAIVAGADTYITGEAGFHTLTDCPGTGINIIEAGHFFTENPICGRLRELVLNALPDAYIEIVNSFDIKVI